MKTIRMALTFFSVLLLMGGYLASQYAYFKQEPISYAAKLNQPSVHLLAALLLVSAVVLSFVREGKESPR